MDIITEKEIRDMGYEINDSLENIRISGHGCTVDIQTDTIHRYIKLSNGILIESKIGNLVYDIYIHRDNIEVMLYTPKTL